MKSAGLIVEISSPQQLTTLLKKYLSGDERPDIDDKLSTLANFQGATNKSIQHLQELL